MMLLSVSDAFAGNAVYCLTMKAIVNVFERGHCFEISLVVPNRHV